MNSWLDLTLSMEQELFLERFKRDINNIPRAELEQYMIDCLKQQLAYKNALVKMFKR